VPKWGVTCAGARTFLIAYNVNVLGTKEQAHRIALNVREQGRGVTGELGRLKKLKAIGWWLDEENMAQVSMNLDDFRVTNLHQAYEVSAEEARDLKLSLCGSQLVGLVPLEAILLAADFYIKRDELLVLEEESKVKLVVQKLGLSSIGDSKWNPQERIIEYIMDKHLADADDENNSKNNQATFYLDGSVRKFVRAVGSRATLPGGGCVSALVASLGAALATMCSLVTYGYRRFEKVDKQIREVLPHLYDAYNELAYLIDQDALAFTQYSDARKMRNNTDEEKRIKEECVEKGLMRCIEVPFKVLECSRDVMPYFARLAPIFNIEARSDLLVAVKCLETGMYGAYHNVQINAKYFKNEDHEKMKAVDKILEDSRQTWFSNKSAVEELIKIIETRE